MAEPHVARPSEAHEPKASRAAGPSDPQTPGRRIWAWTLAAAFLAGVASWLVTEGTYHTFKPPSRMITSMGITFDSPLFSDKVIAGRKNASLVVGLTGGLLGLALGVAGGLSRGSWRAAVTAGVTGAVLSAAAGVAAATVLLPIYFHQLETAQEELSRDLLFPLLIHAGIFGALGAGAGAGLGFGLGRPGRFLVGLLGGLIGGVLGAALYEVVGALALPSGLTTEPIAGTWVARLVCTLLIALLTSLVATALVSAPARAKRPETQPIGSVAA